MRNIASTLCLVAVIAGSILRAVLGSEVAALAAAAALLAYVALEGWAARNGRRMLVLAVLAALAAIAFHPDPWPLLTRALEESASLIGLFAALGMLREASQSSPMILACGEEMVRQPPGRRYLVLTLGSHVTSLVLNFGVLSLLGTMVARGNTLEAAGGEARIQAIRAQRMLSAILRGFATMTVWSPLSVSFAVTQAVVPGLDWWRLLSLQLGLTALMLGLGWALDRRAFPTPPSLPGVSGTTRWAPLARLALLVAAVVAAAISAAEILGQRPVLGAMLVVPPAALIWLAVQQRSLPGAVMELSGRLTQSLPRFRDEVAMLGGAMFLGIVVAAFVPPQAVARLLSAIPLPPVLLIVLMAWAVMALAQIGLSQIVTITLLGGAVSDLAGLGITPLALASGLMGAWALSACSTPVGAAVLTVSRLADVPVRVVARDWNGTFVLAGAGLLALWLVVLDWALR